MVVKYRTVRILATYSKVKNRRLRHNEGNKFKFDRMSDRQGIDLKRAAIKCKDNPPL